jgi:protein required for attachment to host cells
VLRPASALDSGYAKHIDTGCSQSSRSTVLISDETGEKQMKIPKGATIAVADGEILNLFRNDGDETSPSLSATPGPLISTENKGSGGRHQSSSANPSDSQQDEDSFAAGTVAMLNKRVLDGKISSLIVVAAPRTLGELRKHYHKGLSAILVGEIAKDLTGHSVADVAKTIAAA